MKCSEQLRIGGKGDILAGSLTLTANEPARMSPSLYEVDKLHLTAPMEFGQNFIPCFVATAICCVVSFFRRTPVLGLGVDICLG